VQSQEEEEEEEEERFCNLKEKVLGFLLLVCTEEEKRRDILFSVLQLIFWFKRKKMDCYCERLEKGEEKRRELGWVSAEITEKQRHLREGRDERLKGVCISSYRSFGRLGSILDQTIHGWRCCTYLVKKAVHWWAGHDVCEERKGRESCG
jgi:hypothetical protein